MNSLSIAHSEKHVRQLRKKVEFISTKSISKVVLHKSPHILKGENKRLYKFEKIVEPLEDGLLRKKLETQNICLSLTGIGTIPLEKCADGAVLVDKETNTLAYYAENAKRVLNITKKFDKDTTVIIPADGIAKITTGGETLTFSDTGAIMIGAGTIAKVKVLKGEPLLIISENKPEWYKKLSPEGIHRQQFEEIVLINKEFFRGHIRKSIFKDKLDLLLSNDIIKSVNDLYAKWNDFESDLALKEKLRSINIFDNDCEMLLKVWEKAHQRKFYELESGHILKNDLDNVIIKKLINNNILVKQRQNSEKLFWTGYNTVGEIRDRLFQAGLSEAEKKKVMELWSFTNRSGFDGSGLIWQKDNVVVYSLKEKANLWSHEDTEWITNSTAFAGVNGPFITGVSSVVSKDNYIEPIAFKDIRPGEILHNHPAKVDMRQSEVYLVTNGKAVLLIMQNNKPEFQMLQKGDMVVINPGVTHCVLGIQGKYEHMVFQVPSAFQYGFMFKEYRDYKDFNISEEEVLKIALDKLKHD